ncbi:hypothetical protein AX14_011093 [Amanita brunnescens Koide BX004]|nr:hypothetical protein AX14_011093 [Amanita brunnescens Koide BX004]
MTRRFRQQISFSSGPSRPIQALYAYKEAQLKLRAVAGRRLKNASTVSKKFGRRTPYFNVVTRLIKFAQSRFLYPPLTSVRINVSESYCHLAW